MTGDSGTSFSYKKENPKVKNFIKCHELGNSLLEASRSLERSKLIGDHSAGGLGLICLGQTKDSITVCYPFCIKSYSTRNISLLNSSNFLE
ncbi:hypothetical protein CYK22_04015 [Streptococcus salivarius]|nr:hypothetical protein CYK22_04015 [Streptococcus salivarius]